MTRSPWPLLIAIAVTVAIGIGSFATRDERARPPHARASTPAVQEGPSYVAIGDSFTAGDSIGEPQPGSGHCLRSTRNYPSLVARDLGYVLTDVSCSGATTHGVLASSSYAPAQIAALSAKTALVTVSIGGNDLGLFRAVLDHCLQGHADCLAGLHATRDLALVQRHLVTALRAIHARAPEARVILVGYPQLVAAGSRGCALLPAAPAVLTRVHGLIEDLARAMARAAGRGGATYVDLIGPSAGHDICSDSPWVNGRATTDRAVAFHPLLAEQEAVARLIGPQVQAGVPAP